MFYSSCNFLCLSLAISINYVAPEKQSDQSDCSIYRAVVRAYDTFKSVQGENCCDLTGCVSNKPGSVYEHWPVVPWCLDKIKPEFYLYTPDNAATNQTIDIFNLHESVKKLTLNKGIELYAIIHGWNTEWVLTEWMFPMKDALIKKGKNVIIVRWSEGSNVKDYFQGAVNTLPVGVALGLLMSTLVEQGKADLNSTTILGFSLGAHAAGFAGKNLTAVKRIIGLDPAGPLFVCENSDTRLSEDDAKFVQIFHTNGQLVLLFGRGTVEQMGHIDFYANGGLIQPGCEAGLQQTKEDVTKFNFTNVWKNTACSHARAPLVFTEMVSRSNDPNNKCTFKSFPCEDFESWKNGKCFNCNDPGCPVPGPDMDYGTPYKGRYYFGTLPNTDEEFCARQYVVTLSPDVKVSGQISLILRGPPGETNSIKFQGEDSTIEEGQTKTRIFNTPWNLDKITRILLTYTRHKNIIFNNGVKKFSLTNATITSMDGSMVSLCSSVTVQSGEPTTINFPPCHD